MIRSFLPFTLLGILSSSLFAQNDYWIYLDEMTKGKMWRMGSNYWTLLDTNLLLSLDQLELGVGLYFLAIRRSENGDKWELVFIEPNKSRQKGLDAYDVGTRPQEIPILFSTPLRFQKSKDIVQKLTILLSLNQGSETRGTMRLSWGDFKLSADLRVQLPAQK